jgi:chromosome segregation ATPase
MTINGTHIPTELRTPADVQTGETALAPVVDKLAFGIAKGVVALVRELEGHIAAETRKVGEAIDRRLDTIQASLQQLSRFAEEQRAANTAMQDRIQQLTNADASLRETTLTQSAELERLGKQAAEFSSSVAERIEGTAAALRAADTRHNSALETLRNETLSLSSDNARRIDELLRDLGVYQEDMAALKEPVGTLFARVDSLIERMDRQADAFRSMNAAYSQRESELEQVMDGLARLRTYKTSLPANGL